jgi:hypothetical protein
MVKHRNIQYFTATVNGQEITFRCHTTDTRNGFCHTAHYTGWDYDITDSKCPYINRTWERFTYESVLIKAIEKLPESVRQQVYDQLIDHKAAEIEEQCNKELAAFEKLHESLTPENKERLANSGIEINSEGDMHAVMGLMGLMNLMQ